MNIEEAIKLLNELKKNEWGELLNCWDYGTEESEVIEVLLTAYEKEKEKNKEEYDKGFKDGFVKGVQPQIFENWNKANAKVVNIESQFVSKDKIKAKIDEYENEGMIEIKAVLQSLLE